MASLLPPNGDADVNAADGEGKTALHWTGVLGNGKVAAFLVGVDGVRVNVQDVYGWTPLALAVANNHRPVVDALLDHPEINVNVLTLGGESPLDMAVANDVQAVIDALREKGGLTCDEVIAKEEAEEAGKRSRRR